MALALAAYQPRKTQSPPKQGICHDSNLIGLERGMWECVRRLNLFDYRSGTKEIKDIRKGRKI